ncbi:hypothetical protein MPH_05590 [Macrophomina phaseolina MS6]|uniref:Extracellular mutant protein 11 C-terminal domain-containing protein n=1 Tax=Macrophomina phaseolina (strain MS6) TaxID=1126212 RepID=K2RWW4_MACPH|nr:hypothetical protein MPH_05590 [Macrophomina phaseolina MS6]
MQKFVIHRNDSQRTGSAVPNRCKPHGTLTTEERYRRAASARVTIPDADVQGSQYDSDGESARQYMARSPEPAAVRGQNVKLALTQKHRNDGFDTDPENADVTTTTNFSNVDGQASTYVQGDYHTNEDHDTFNGDESQFAEDEESAGDRTPPHVPQRNNLEDDDMTILSQAMRQAGYDPFAASQSYPPTSHPDEEEDEEGELKGNYKNGGPELLHPESPNIRTHAQWPESQEIPPSYMSQDPYNRLRQVAPRPERTRSDTKLPLRNGADGTEPVRPQTAISMHSIQYQQQDRIARPATAQRRPISQTPRHSPTPSNAKTVNERNLLGVSAHQYPMTPSEASTEMPLDYSQDELFRKSYTELHKEPFDFEPRNDPTKQPLAHLNNKSLDERMDAAFKELRPEDQATFFATLDIDEWEQAGEWFLDEFGELAKRFKAARRKKREAARKFEDEIRKRNDAVSRKRQCVEDHIVEMKAKGSSLLPQTPSRKARMSRAATPR